MRHGTYSAAIQCSNAGVLELAREWLGIDDHSAAFELKTAEIIVRRPYRDGQRAA